jgi:curved DNA-binding protein CbpA
MFPQGDLDTMNLYEVLGVTRDADYLAITKAYRARALRLHPDAGGTQAEFEQIKLARDVLCDPDRRRHYDATGAESPPRADNAAAEIAQTVLKAIETVLGAAEFDIEHDDAIACAIASLEANADGIRQQRAGVEQQAARYRKALARLKPARDGDPPGQLHDMLAVQIAHIERHVGTGDAHLARLDAACAELRKYRYEVDIVLPQLAPQLGGGLGNWQSPSAMGGGRW